MACILMQTCRVTDHPKDYQTIGNVNIFFIRYLKENQQGREKKKGSLLFLHCTRTIVK